MEAAEASVDHGELPLQKILRLEREKRIAAELLVEKERQALLQLKYLLLKRKKDGESVDKEEVTLTKEPLKRTVSNSSVGLLPRAFSQEFTASVLGELPGDVQQSLELQKLAVSASDDTPVSKAMAAISCHDDRKLLEIMSEKGSKQLIAEHGIHLLSTAAKQGVTGCTRLLLQLGCDPNLQTLQNPSPVLLVAKNGNIGVLQILIDHHADVNVVDRLGYCPLYLALQGGRREMVEAVLSANPKMDIMTGYDNSVIHAAVLQDNPILLRMVVVKLRGSCDLDTVCHVINKRNEDGYSPLHQASAEGYKYCVEVLCACPEVDVSLTDFRGRTAVDIAPPDCQILLENRMFKEVPIVMETEEASHPKLIVGMVRILPHHTWSDFRTLVSEQLRDFRNTIRGDMGVAIMGNRRFPTFPISMTQSKIPVELRQLLELDSSALYDNIQATVDSQAKRLSNFELQFSKMEPSLIGRYLLSEEVELESRGQTNKTPFKLIECIEDIGEVIEVKLGLSSRTNRLAIRSMIPLPILEEYIQMATRNKLFMIHGSPETDLSFLTYNLIECIKISELPHPPVFEEVRIQLHSNFTRDDLICTLQENKLLQNVKAKDKSIDDKAPVILLFEGTEKLPDYDLLEDMCLLMGSQETGRGVWLCLSNQSPSCKFVQGKYKLRNVGYLIATRVLHKSVGLPSVVIDNYAHIWLTDTTEPILGKLLRTLLCQLIHVRKGHTLSRYDSLYQVVMWVWQFWVLYNHYMELLDFHHLKLGPKMFLNCPVKTNDADHVYNWFLEMWNFHLVPKIRDTILDPEVKLKTKKINRGETVRMLMLFLTQRVMHLTCPLYPEGTFNLIKNLYGVGDLQNLTFPAFSEEQVGGDQASSSGELWRSPTLSLKNKFKAVTPVKVGSPKGFHKSSMSLQEVSLSPPLSGKKNSAHKQSHRPKGGNIFGRTSTLRKSLFKGSRASLYSVVEEGGKKKSGKSKKEQGSVQTERGPDQHQEMEQLLDMLMSSESSRIDEQRVAPFPTPSASSSHSHHKISVSPSESSHGSIENTPPTNDLRVYHQVLSDHDSWMSQELVNKQDAEFEAESNPMLLSRLTALRQPARSRSQSVENVFSASTRQPSLEDILRPSSEVSLHRREISNSSELLSNSQSSVETSSVSCSVHESVPSFGNQNMVEELYNSNDGGGALLDQEIEKGRESVGVPVSPESSGTETERVKRNSKTLAFYSATLGLTMNASVRHSSIPAHSEEFESYAVINGRKIRTPPAIMMWGEEQSIEM